MLEKQRRLQERMERNPNEFLALELPHALRTGANRLATFINGAGSDLVLIENATAGCNMVLGSVRLPPGHEILVTDHGYPAIRKAAEHHASRAGAVVIEARVPFPIGDPIEIINAVVARLGQRSRLVILDHQFGIAKETGRSQLKSIFAKTGAHRQAELVALLAPLLGRIK